MLNQYSVISVGFLFFMIGVVLSLGLAGYEFTQLSFAAECLHSIGFMAHALSSVSLSALSISSSSPS